MPTHSQARLYNAAFKASPLATFLLCEHGKIKENNDAALKLFGIEQEELLDRPFETLLGQHAASLDEKPLPKWDTLKKGYKFLEVNCFGPQKRLRHCLLSLVALERSNEFAYVAHLQDITGLRSIESDLMESRLRYRSIIDEAGDAIVTINDKGIIEMVNTATTTLFGHSKEEMMGKKVNMLMPFPDKAQHDSYLENYKSTGHAKIIGKGREVRGLKKNGKTFPLWLNVTDMQFRDRRVFTAIMHDLSEVREAQEMLENYAEELKTLNAELEGRVKERTQELDKAIIELEKRNLDIHNEMQAKAKAKADLNESQKLFKAVTEQFPDGFILVFDDKREAVLLEGLDVPRLREAMDVGFGIGWKKELGHKLYYLIDHYEQEINMGNRISVERQIGELYYKLSISALTQNQEVRQLMLVGKNISELKRAQQNALKALSKEKKLNELKGRFMTMASHEFRTPLATILSSASILGRYTETDQQPKREKHINRIKSAVSNMNQLLGEFISLEKLQEGILQLKPEAFEIEAFFEDILADVVPLAKSGQRILLKLGDKGSFSQDPMMLKNIMLNLLSNAIKYSPEDSVIELKVALESEKLHIGLSDEGIGISPEDQKQLFQWFFRGENVSNVQGTGIGLYLVKRYTDLMGGQVSFESKIEKGTTFRLELPRH